MGIFNDRVADREPRRDNSAPVQSLIDACEELERKRGQIFSIYPNQAMEILDQSNLDDYDDDCRKEAKKNIVVDEVRGRRTDA
ncbi:hypothetical protein LTR49_001360 [Elasticomyces elasticus]|nr:hypothetical protein LTR49_001360 [Elasticomyces elasticus]